MCSGSRIGTESTCVSICLMEQVVKVEVQAETARRGLAAKGARLAGVETQLTAALHETNRGLQDVSDSRQLTTADVQDTFRRLRLASDVREKEVSALAAGFPWVNRPEFPT